jgi:hypothetical protein
MREFENHKGKHIWTHVVRIIEPQTNVQRGDGRDFVISEVEANDIKVLCEALGVVALGDDCNVTLGSPAKEDLGSGLVVLLSDIHDGVVHKKGFNLHSLLPGKLNEALRAEGRVSSHSDTLLLGEEEEVRLEEVGMVLNLENGHGDLGIAEEVHEERTLEVGDTDGTGDLLLNKTLESSPGLLDGNVDGNNPLINTVITFVGPFCGVVFGVVDVFGGNGEVDQVEVEIAVRRGKQSSKE